LTGRRRISSGYRLARRAAGAALAAAAVVLAVAGLAGVPAAAGVTAGVPAAAGVTAGVPGANAAAAGAHGAPAARPPWRLRLAIQYLPPATNHSEYDVVLTGPSRTWFLGGSDIFGHGKPVAEQIASGVPHAAVLPSGPHSWITAASAPSPTDIWAVTYLGGSVLHWNGAKWATEPRGNWKPGTRFTGVLALSHTNVWVFGTAGRHHPGAGTWHFNGTRWTRVGGAAGSIFQASRAGPGDAWAIGNAGGTNNALLHFNGTEWRRVRPPALAGFRYSHVLALSPFDVWAAGSVAGVPKLGHLNARGWAALSMPGTTAATGMCRDGHGGLWVIANSGKAPSLVRRRAAGGTWTRAVVSAKAANEILACALIRGTASAWGAGKATAPQGSAAAVYRNG